MMESNLTSKDPGAEQLVQIRSGRFLLDATLLLAPDSKGLIIFAHGSGSSRFSPRNRMVASALKDAGLCSLLMDLLTAEEDLRQGARFEIGVLTERLIAAVEWSSRDDRVCGLPLGLFGSSTGAAAALQTAARLGDRISAVVSRGGRPDMAAPVLTRVACPTLLIVGGDDTVVLSLNEHALDLLAAKDKALAVIPGATHLFEEPGALEQVAKKAADWFLVHL